MGKKPSNLKKLISSIKKGAVVLPKVKSPSPPPLFPPNHPSNRQHPSTSRQVFVPAPLPSRKRKRSRGFDDLEQMDDQHEGAFSVTIDQYGKESLIDSRPINSYAAVKKQKRTDDEKRNKRNRYAQQSSSSSSSSSGSESEEDEDDPRLRNEIYNTTQISDHFYYELVVNAPISERDNVYIDFDPEPKYHRNRNPFAYECQKSEFESMLEIAPEDKIDDLNEVITDLQTQLNVRPDACSFSSTGNRHSLWLDLIAKRREAFKYRHIGEWPRQEAEEDEEKEHLLTMISALEKLNEHDQQMLLPAYIEQVVRWRQKDKYDPQDFFDKISKGRETSLNVNCWRKVFAAFITHYPTFDVDSVSYMFDQTIQQCSSLCFASSVNRSVPHNKLNQIMVETLLARSRLDIETGNVARVVALIQALTEFHYCAPEALKSRSFEGKFEELRKYYEYGYDRFGEGESNSGWSDQRLELSHKHKNKLKERERLAKLLKDMNEEEIQEIREALEAGETFGSIWTIYENSRAAKFWQPLKFEHEGLSNEIPNMYISLDSLKLAIQAMQTKKYAPFVIFKHLQILGASFGPMPIRIQNMILDNDQFSSLINTFISGSDEFYHFKNNNSEMYEFLISFMFQLIKMQLKQKNNEDKELESLTFALVHGIVETLRSQLSNCVIDTQQRLEVVRSGFDHIFGQIDKIERRHHLNEAEFARIKILELDADQRCFPSNWVELERNESGREFAKSSIYQQLIRIIQSLKKQLYATQNAQDRALIFYAVLQILKRLDSYQSKDVSIYNRARFLVLFLGAAPRGLEAFMDKNFKIQAFDLQNAIKTLQSFFDSESDKTSSPLFNIIGTPKDLALQLYAIMYYEAYGKSLFVSFDELMNRDEEANEEEGKKNIKLKVYLKNSLFFPFYRVQFCEPLLRRNLISHVMYNSWALDLLHQHPYHQLTWQSALPAVDYNHCLLERRLSQQQNGCCNSGSVKRSLLHWLLVFVNQWRNGKLSDDNLPRLRTTLKNAVNDARNLAFPDSTAARLSLLLEIGAGSRFEIINNLYRTLLQHFPYAKNCTFDVLPQIFNTDPRKLDGIDDLLQRKGHRVFLHKKELEQKIKEIRGETNA